jgi:hypothetical protein
MYRKHKDSSELELQGLIVNIPPVGWVYDNFSGEWVKTGVYSRSSNKKNQFWERQPLPDWYDKKRKEEERIIEETGNRDYVISECEEVRKEHWFKRMNGFWFYNDGEPTYITGLHWFYLNWWPIDVGYPWYFDYDRKRFYHLEYCAQDPRSYGRVEMGPRRCGKTYVGGVFTYEPASRTPHSNAGIQSKTNQDGKKVFGKAIVSQFRKLPHFFKPVYDTSSGTIPKSEIRFFNTSQKGKSVEQEVELESIIDFRPSGLYAYDGEKMITMLHDEVFKTEEVDIYERFRVVKECLVDNITERIIGKALLTSTVEEIEGKLQCYMDLWDDSDPEKRDSNGHTKSGLYRYFISAAETRGLDKYGKCDKLKNEQTILNTIQGLGGDQKAVSDYKRKYPLSPKDAFRPQSKDCHYNLELLEDRYDILTTIESKWRTGDFKLVNPNDIWKGVVFVEKKNGKFKLHKSLDLGDPNLWNQVGGTTVPIPRNKMRFCLATDPFDHKTTEDGRKSNGGISAFRKFDSRFPFDSDKFVLTYANRPKTPSILYEDIIMACWFFGGDILYENNKPGFAEWCDGRNRFDMNFSKFLIHLDGRKEPGIPGTPGSHLEIVNHTLQYIEDCIDNEDSIDLIEEWIKFDINKTTKFDLGMTSGYNLIAANRFMSKVEKTKKEDYLDIQDVFYTYK